MTLAGIRKGFICKKGSPGLIAGAQYPWALGLTKPGGKLSYKGTDEIATSRGGKKQNQMEFTYEETSLQPTPSLLDNILHVFLADGGVSCQVVAQKVSANAYGGVYNFDSDSYFGLAFEYLLSNKENSLKLMLTNKLEYDFAQEVLAAALTNSDLMPQLTVPILNSGIDHSKYIRPGFSAFETPKGTEVFGASEFAERKILLKSSGQKNENTGREEGHFIDIEIEYTGSNAAIEKQLTIMGKNDSASVYAAVKYGTVGTIAFDIAEGVLTRREEFDLENSKRPAKIILSGQVNPFDISVDIYTNDVIIWITN